MLEHFTGATSNNENMSVTARVKSEFARDLNDNHVRDDAAAIREMKGEFILLSNKFNHDQQWEKEESIKFIVLFHYKYFKYDFYSHKDNSAKTLR